MVSREELYKLVWSEPMTKVAARFEVSGSYMARICTLLNVPRPERGYWAKLAVGKALPPEALPAPRPGDQLYWSKDGGAPPPQVRQVPQVQPKSSVRIPRDQVHGLISGSKVHFANSRPVEEGAYLKPYKKLLVDVTASRERLDLALDLANELFMAFERRGHRVRLAPSDQSLRRIEIDEREAPNGRRDRYHRGPWSPYRPTVVYIGNVAIGLAIIEMTEEVVLRYVRGKYIREADYVPPKFSRYSNDLTWTTTRELPSGRLRLVAYSPYWRVDWSSHWQDTKKSSVRTALKSIAVSVEEAAAALVGKLEEADRRAEIERLERLAAEERRRRDEDRRRVAESIRESHTHLGQIIQQWAQVMQVETFLAGVEKRAVGLPADEKNRIMERLNLAREFLGVQEPLDFFLSWRTPEERYRPVYPNEEAAQPD